MSRPASLASTCAQPTHGEGLGADNDADQPAGSFGRSGISPRARATGYDDEIIRFLTAHVAPGGLVLDIGASLGFYTVPLAVAARSVDAKVLGIERFRPTAHSYGGTS